MTIKSFLFAASTLAILATTSCKKDDDNGGGGSQAPSASSLTAGTGYLTFTTDKAFNGSTTTTFKEAMPYDQMKCIRQSNTVNMSGFSAVVSGANAKTVVASLVFSGTSTLKSDFGNSGVVLSFAVSSTSGTTGTIDEGYAMVSGTFEVTKLTSTEVEGKFSGKAENDENNTSINVTSGSFSGKF